MEHNDVFHTKEFPEVHREFLHHVVSQEIVGEGSWYKDKVRFCSARQLRKAIGDFWNDRGRAAFEHKKPFGWPRGGPCHQTADEGEEYEEDCAFFHRILCLKKPVFPCRSARPAYVYPR